MNCINLHANYISLHQSTIITIAFIIIIKYSSSYVLDIKQSLHHSKCIRRKKNTHFYNYFFLISTYEFVLES